MTSRIGRPDIHPGIHRVSDLSLPGDERWNRSEHSYASTACDAAHCLFRGSACLACHRLAGATETVTVAGGLGTAVAFRDLGVDCVGFDGGEGDPVRKR